MCLKNCLCGRKIKYKWCIVPWLYNCRLETQGIGLDIEEWSDEFQGPKWWQEEWPDVIQKYRKIKWTLAYNSSLLLTAILIDIPYDTR